jgi:uncharacterized damage-inducible protein DinB
LKENERTPPPPSQAPEREMLDGFLQFQRDTLEWKCSDLTSEQLKQAVSPPSPLTLLGLLRHMTEVENFWFSSILMGRDGDVTLYNSGTNREADWTALDTHSVEDVFRNWKRAVEISRRNAASIQGLDTPAARENPPDPEPNSLRWIMTHMIEEYARHNGHADLLRERIDGQTGE